MDEPQQAIARVLARPSAGFSRKLTFSGGTLLLDRMTSGAMQEVFDALPWVWDARTHGWRTDAIHYADVRSTLEAGRWQAADQVPGWEPVHWPARQSRTLRPDQQQAVESWSATGRGVVVMPTGTGKTEVAIAIMRSAGVSTLIVAPVRDLMYQWQQRIYESLGYDAGIIGDSLFRLRPVSVTTYDSACIHMDGLGNRFGLIVFDECHHLPGPLRRDAARMCAAPLRLGLTATPLRCDGKHTDLDWLVGRTVYEMPMAAAKGAVLANYDVVKIPVHFSPSERQRYRCLTRQMRSNLVALQRSGVASDWKGVCAAAARDPRARRALRDYQAARSMEQRAREKLRVLEDLFRLHCGSRIIIFTGSNAMAREVSRRFLIPCLLNHCRKAERREILRGLEEGLYPAVVANQVLDEGVDLPEAKVAVVIGGLSSPRQGVQRLGRILRRSGEARAVLYEVVCSGTSDERASRRRRKSDAYQGTRRCRV